MSSSPSTSSFSSTTSFPKMIEELESKWSRSVPEALKFFDKICHDVEDDGQRQEASKFVASKIRTASVYRRSKIFEELGKSSVMGRIYLSHEFRSVQDCNFPRMEIFYINSRLTPTPVFLHPAHSITMVFGNNENFNLGISNNAIPIEEMIMLNCRKIRMSNVHTLFLTHDRKVYGCGKASLLRIDDEESADEYFVEPTLLRIPADEFVEDILAEKDGSLIVTDKFMYAIGSINVDAFKERETTFLSANCKRIVVVKETGRGYKFRCDPNWCSKIMSMFLHDHDEVELKTLSSKAKVHIHRIDGYLQFAFASRITEFTKCQLVLNGKLVDIMKVVKHYTSPDGKIVMKLENGILVKGRLEIVLRERDAKMRNNQISKEVIAIVDEVPGSYGVATFCCSLDLENCIFQIGQTEQKLMHPFKEDLYYEKNNIFTEEHQKVQKAVARTSPTETIDSLCETLERFITLLNENCSAKIWCRNPFSCGLKKMQSEISQVICTPSVHNITRIDGEETYEKKQIVEMIQKTIPLIHCQKSEISDSKIQQFGCLARVAERLLAEEIAWADVEADGTFQHDCRLLIRPSLKTVNISKIVSDRVKSGELEPNEIPIDLKIIVAAGPEHPKYLISKTNKTLFELMYPDWAEKIENGCLNLTGSYVHNFFFKRFDSLAAEKAINWDYWLPDVARQIVDISPAGNVFCRLVQKTSITDFAGLKTSSDNIWYLEALDGNRIPVHKFLILLHSRRAQASRRFDSMQGVSKSETQEPTIIKTIATSDVIENAMRALLDMSTLYDKNIDDVTAVLDFFDYNLMEEALDDGIKIVIGMLNDSNLDVLYWLFEKFEQRITPHLLKHNRLILMSASEHIPPRGFIKRFSELVSGSLGTENGANCSPKPINIRKLKAEDVMTLMIDFAADQDESVLKAFADEWELDFETVRTIQMSSLKKGEKPWDENNFEIVKKPRLE